MIDLGVGEHAPVIDRDADGALDLGAGVGHVPMIDLGVGEHAPVI